MNKELFEKRKKVIYDLVCDKHYVPMKAKELAMLLQVPKDEREALVSSGDETLSSWIRAASSLILRVCASSATR